MKVCSFGCERYKAFEAPVSLTLRPLTLFFGKNNSGKSALLRLIRLLVRAASSRVRTGFPTSVDQIDFGHSFRELIHGGSTHGHVKFALGLEEDGEGKLLLDVTVQNFLDPAPVSGRPGEYPVVSGFRLTAPATELDWRWVPGADITANYAGVGRVPFKGILPAPMTGGAAAEHQPLFDRWRYKISFLDDLIEHLGPIRIPAERIYEVGPPQPMDFFGQGMINHLVHVDGLVDRVGDWYRQHMDGWHVSLDSDRRIARIVLGKGRTTGINLKDAGQGMQNILPVVVQQLKHHLTPEEPFFDLIEEPELHLHPAAQAPLGDLFLQTAKLGRGQVLVETHSENLLLRIRRRISEGVYDPGLVALYWIEDGPEGNSTVKRIDIRENGDVDWWPDGIFSEGYQEVRALGRARSKQGNEGGRS